MSAEYDNIPGSKLRRLADEYRSIKTKIATLTEEAQEIHEQVIALGIGSYASVSVYQVAETTVRRHVRRGYKAIRARVR